MPLIRYLERPIQIALASECINVRNAKPLGVNRTPERVVTRIRRRAGSEAIHVVIMDVVLEVGSEV
jgi:hypothetical protein